MPRLKLLVFVLLLALTSAAAAQRPATPLLSTRETGLAADRLARIDRVFQQHVDENRIAGAVALVLRDGRPVYERAFGWSDKESGRKMTTDAIFRIASQSKALTSVAILALMEEGALTLSTPVSRFIPEFAKTTVATKTDAGVAIEPAKRQINIKDLLTHTAGVSYGTDAIVSSQYQAKALGPAAGFGWYTADKDEPICDTMARLASLPFVAHPGESYVYGYNTDILGCVVERASGMPLDQFFATRITGPLGMKDTRFFLPADQRARLATVYSTGADGTIVRAPEGARGQGHYVEGPRKSFSGGAGLLSTARDYARFLEMVRNGGALDGERILSPRTVALMTTNQIGTLRGTPGLGFGLGFETVDHYGAKGLSAVGAFGWGGAYGSQYQVDPASRLVLVYMVQLLPSRSDLGQAFPTLVYQALVEPVGTGTH
jgi:CubicO group peptidase (beta-lactamase class C family)